jgi:hypothetical protein
MTTVILGFIAKIAFLRRVKRAAQNWRAGKRIAAADLRKIREGIETT